MKRRGDPTTIERLVASGQRLGGIDDEASLMPLVLDEVVAHTRATRALLIVDEADGPRVVDARLPPDEEADALLAAIGSWLSQVRRTRSARLHQGPAGVPSVEQRSCLVVPLVADGDVSGFLYADMDGHEGRFDEGHAQLVTPLAGIEALGADVRRAETGVILVHQRSLAVQCKFVVRPAAEDGVWIVGAGDPRRRQ